MVLMIIAVPALKETHPCSLQAETEVSREKASRKDESPDGLVQDMQKFSP